MKRARIYQGKDVGVGPMGEGEGEGKGKGEDVVVRKIPLIHQKKLKHEHHPASEATMTRSPQTKELRASATRDNRMIGQRGGLIRHGLSLGTVGRSMMHGFGTAQHTRMGSAASMSSKNLPR